MNLPNIPTDNLYKFLALTGLIIFLVSLGFKHLTDYNQKIQDAEILVGREYLDMRMDNYFKITNSRFELMKTRSNVDSLMGISSVK